ncbi:MAG: hypothetical protein GVY04_22795 [Cyanobacteria bacterium]|nr:hypothetical protein [Cyanobacteria bacterium GSL.Bin1]
MSLPFFNHLAQLSLSPNGKCFQIILMRREDPRQLSLFEWMEEQVTGSPEPPIIARSV